VRGSLLEVLDRLDASSAATIAALRVERAALSATVSSERAAILTAADEQRRALTADAGTLADRLVASTGDQIRRLTREVLLLFILLAAVVLGLPFGAGYLVGRAQRSHRVSGPH
jgi:hypothetical protein